MVYESLDLDYLYRMLQILRVLDFNFPMIQVEYQG